MLIPEILRIPADDTEFSQVRQLRLWDVDQERYVGRPIPFPRSSVAALSPINQTLAIVVPESEPSTENRPSQSRQLQSTSFELQFWDVAKGEQVGESEPITAGDSRFLTPEIAFNADGSQVLVATPRLRTNRRELARGSNLAVVVTIRAFDSTTAESLGEQVEIVSRARIIASTIFSPDATRILILDNSTFYGRTGLRASQFTGSLHNVRTGDPVGQPIVVPGEFFGGLACTPDAGRIAFLVHDREGDFAQVWDVESGEATGPRIDFGREASQLRLFDASDDGSQIVTGSIFGEDSPAIDDDEGVLLERTIRSQIQVWDTGSGKPLTPPLPMPGPARAGMLSGDEHSITVRTTNSLRIWELPRAQLRRTVLPNEGPTSQWPLGFVAFSLGRNGQAPTGLGAIAFGSENDLVMGGDENGPVEIIRWDIKSGEFKNQLELPDSDNQAAACLSSNGRFLATFTGGRNNGTTQIRCWRTDNGERIGEPIDHAGIVAPLAISPDGEQVVVTKLDSGRSPRSSASSNDRGNQSGQQDGNRNGPGRGGQQPNAPGLQQLFIYETATGQPKTLPLRLRRTEPIHYAQFLDNGALVFGHQNMERIHFWNPESGVIRELTSPNVTVTSAQSGPRNRILQAVSSDGHLLALSIDGFTVEVWDLQNGKTLGAPMQHPGAITAIAFDNQSQAIATACVDGLVRQWSLPTNWSGDPESIMARVEALTGLNLDDEGNVEPLEPGAQLQQLETSNDLDSRASLEALTHSELQTLMARESQHWAAADAGFERWIADRPQDWQPQLLRVRPLVELGQWDQAEQHIKRAVQILDETTVSRWLEKEIPILSEQRRSTTDEQAETARQAEAWYAGQLLQLAAHDKQRTAQVLSLQVFSFLRVIEPERLLEILNESLEIAPTNLELRRQSARVHSKHFQWEEAIADYEVIVEADPTDHWSRYHFGSVLLYTGNIEKYRELTHDMLDRWFESDEPRTPERTAKLCLLLPVEGDDLDRTLALADRAFEEVASNSNRPHDVMIKGIAEYRRGNYSEAIANLDECIPTFDTRGEYSEVYSALGNLFAAMALHHLGETEKARERFAQGVDRIDAVDLRHIASRRTAYPHDWLNAEIARREAEQLLNTTADSIDLPLPDTGEWRVLFEDDFERTELGPDWTAEGDWTIENGRLRGELTLPDLWDLSSGRITLEELPLPNRVEIEFDAWWPAGSSGEVKLTNADLTQGYTAVLSNFDHPGGLKRFDKGTGAFLLHRDPEAINRSSWVAGNTDIEFKADERHHVRFLRQRHRVTLFVDGEEMYSQRVHKINAPLMQLYGLGPRRSAVYFDNVRIRIPHDAASMWDATQYTELEDWDKAADAWAEAIQQIPTNDKLIGKAARDLPAEIADRVWNLLPSELQPAWQEASGRPMQHDVESFQRLELQAHANIDVAGDFHIDEDEGLAVLPQGEREFAGVPFDIGPGCLHLNRGELIPGHLVNDYPEVIDNIPVDAQFKRLHLLHSTGYGGRSRSDGLTVGELILHYEDGSETTLPIVYGEHVREWWERDEPDCPQGQIAWTGTSRRSEVQGSSLRLYATSWANPKPELKVTAIDYTSTMTNVAPFCIAMTVEK